MGATWNMHDVAPADRFAYWREAVLQTYLPLEPEKISPDDFDGAITSIGSAALPLSRVQSVPNAIHRTRKGIGSFQDGSFFANLQITGDAVVEQYGQKTLARPGDIVLLDTNEPFAMRFEQGCDLICATIPGTRLRRHLQQMSGRPPNVIAGRGAGRLASAYLGTLRDIPDDFALVDDLAASQLESLLVRATSIGVPAAKSASPREVMLRQIQTFILDELHNPQLSAKYICRHLQISRSHLFAVLADAGTTFAAHVRDARLRHSLNQLRDPRLNDLPIGEIALRVGFKSHESFARAFRRAYGSSPGAMRVGDEETS
ncbi:MAG: helix-turn-helix domain-containing protein [Bradyrhizobium sp.]